MNFSITTDTAGARVGELANELMHFLEDDINACFKDTNMTIGVAIRCLPDSYKRRSFVRYSKKEDYLTIDFCVSLESFNKLYKIEQRFELGKIFLYWLDKGLSNKSFMTSHPDFDGNMFKNKVIELGKPHQWFSDEVDYSQDFSYSMEEFYWRFAKQKT